MHRKLNGLVKLCKVQGGGSDSKTKQALTIVELFKEIEMLCNYGKETEDFKFRVKYSVMTLWQYHLIGRVDDVCHFGMSNTKGYNIFSFALTGVLLGLPWKKFGRIFFL